MPKYYEASQEICDIVDELVEDYHPDLAQASIGLMFRDKAPVSKGRTTLGKAKKVPADMRGFVGLHFVIWVAADEWQRLTINQKYALLDHELCHLVFDDGLASTRGHDVEEFACIIRRWGFWWPGASQYVQAIQSHFEFVDGKGSVRPVNQDVLEQLTGVLADEH